MMGQEGFNPEEIIKMNDQDQSPQNTDQPNEEVEANQSFEHPVSEGAIGDKGEEAGFDADFDMDIDIPDIPIPSAEPEEKAVEDTFKSAFKIAVVGVGQGGGRLAETFWKIGYRRVLCINTAAQDLSTIRIPEENKLLIGGQGAGKNPAKAKEIFRSNYEDILDFCRKHFTGGFDRVLVCIGAGGGTGAGGGPVVIEALHDLAKSLGIEDSPTDAKVGSIIALPTRAEGSRVQDNAENSAGEVVQMVNDKTVSPLILLDNEKIKQIYPKLSINKFWTTANDSVVKLFHLFNQVSAQNSAYTTFDKADLDTVFSSGIITFGAMPITDDKISDAEISGAIRQNLRRNILAGIDLSTGSVAACVLMGGRDNLDNIPQDSIETAFEQLNRLLGDGSTVHRGIYSISKPGLMVYTAIGGLQCPDGLFDMFFKTERKY